MPKCSIANETPFSLNIALLQLAPLHFDNCVTPGAMTTFTTGAVYFTVAVRIDSPSVKGGSNRFTERERMVKVAACAAGGAVAGGALLAGLWWVIPAAGIAEGAAAVGTGIAGGASAAGKLVGAGVAKAQVAKVAVQKANAHYKKHASKYDIALSHGKQYATKHAQTLAVSAVAASSSWFSRSKPAEPVAATTGKADAPVTPSIEGEGPEVSLDVVADESKTVKEGESEETVRVLDEKLLVLQVHGVYVPFKGRQLEVRMLESGALVLWDLAKDVRVK